ncbi:MAG: glycoside hydrolase family 13 protein [Bacteroidales bacterium]|nr:glycoside hydrolase family 13 protein [Bacteroidales bacterium]
MKLKTLALSLLATFAANAAVNIDRVEPTNWYAGMKNPSLQLMVYGKGIKQANVSTDYAGVKVDSVVRLDSPDYLLVYLNLQGAQPGTMKLNFEQGGKKKQVNYEIKRRDMPGEARQGFTNADVLYMLMPDRFADGNVKNNVVKGMLDQRCVRTEPSLRHGGDLEGIRQHLDYFNELGVTTLWFTPVLENDMPSGGGHSSYHGYATTDYYKVDPRFGTNEDYRRLVDEAHQKGLKVVMDMIFNHCGSSHPWQINPPASDWFNQPNYGLQTSFKLTPCVDPYASEIDKRETEEGWFVSSMPDLNQNNPHVATYLIQNSIWWVETVGINGIRMDTYPYAYAAPMARWMKQLNEEYPNFNTVGETWVTQPAYTATWQKDSRLVKQNSNLKTVMDFAFYEAMDSCKHETTDDWWRGFNRVYNTFVYDYLYTDVNHVMAFIENHDTDRFLGEGKDVNRLKQGLALLLTIKRIPQLYYGTEVLMNGVKKVTDGNVRKDFMGGFPGDERNCFTADGRTAEENEMFGWLSRLLHWRKGNDVIVNGTQTQFCPHNGVYVIARRHEGKTVMLMLNGLDKENKVDVKRYAELIGTTAEASNVLTGEKINLTTDIPIPTHGTLLIEF